MGFKFHFKKRTPVAVSSTVSSSVASSGQRAVPARGSPVKSSRAAAVVERKSSSKRYVVKLKANNGAANPAPALGEKLVKSETRPAVSARAASPPATKGVNASPAPAERQRAPSPFSKLSSALGEFFKRPYKKGALKRQEDLTPTLPLPVDKVVDEKTMKKTREILAKESKKRRKRPRRTATEQKRVLSDLITKAGHAIDPDRLKRILFHATLAIIAVATVLVLVIAGLNGANAGNILLFTLGVWTAVFAFVYLFCWMVVYLYLDIRIYRRTQELEEVLPDFLQLASANISAGMPIDRALWFAIRPNFGVLAKEIEEVAKATLAGEELKTSLMKFSDKYDSPTLKRSISILLEGLDSGGEMAELLNKIALNIQEMKILRKEMSASVATYAIFITFAAIVMAPILFGLATELLTIIVGITSTLDLGASSGSMITLNMSSSTETIKNFKIFSIVMLSISAVMSASIVSVIRKGKVKDGLRNLPIFVAVSLTIYFIAVWAMHRLLGGLVG